MELSAARKEENSLLFYVQPTILTDKSYTSDNRFRKLGLPEFGFKLGLHQFSFGLEPLVSFGFHTNSSKRQGNVKYSYQFYNLGFGARQSFWRGDYFPLVPFVEVLGTYRLGRFKTKTYSGNSSSEVTSSGGEIGAELSAGFKASFVHSDRALRSEMDREWSLTDYGLMFYGGYRYSGLLSHGELSDDLGNFSAYIFGGGLYLGW